MEHLKFKSTKPYKQIGHLHFICYITFAEQRRLNAEDCDTAAGREGQRERGQRGEGDGAIEGRQVGLAKMSQSTRVL